MLCVWHQNAQSFQASFSLCPGQVFTELLQMSSAWHKRFLFGLTVIRDLIRSFSMGARLELVQVGLESKEEGRGKTRDQLPRGELVER